MSCSTRSSGIGALQFAWFLCLGLFRTFIVPSYVDFRVFAGLVALELTVPLWAERAWKTAWHPHHIAERYGLFAALAALGSGLKIAVEQTAHPFGSSQVVTGYAVAVPAALFVLLLWVVHQPIVKPPVVARVVTMTAAVANPADPTWCQVARRPDRRCVDRAAAARLIAHTLHRGDAMSPKRADRPARFRNRSLLWSARTPR